MLLYSGASECKIPFSRTKKILRRHEKEKHKKDDKAGVTLLVPVCSWCRGEFHRLSNLKQHLCTCFKRNKRWTISITES